MITSENDSVFDVKPEPTEVLNLTQTLQSDYEFVNLNKISGAMIGKLECANPENGITLNDICFDNLKIENQIDVEINVKPNMQKLLCEIKLANEQIEGTVTKRNRYVSTICSKSYSTRTNFAKYANRKCIKRQNMLAGSESVTGKNCKVRQKQVDERLFKCNSCPKSFKTRQSISQHMKLHHNGRKHKREICLKRFELRNSMLKHVGTLDKQTEHKCEICSKIFKVRGTMLKHVETHSKVRKHHCEICSKSFKTKTTMLQHVESHNEVNKFKCEICSKGFKARYSMLRHIKLHADDSKVYIPKMHTTKVYNQIREETDHKCDICFKSFKQKDCLMSHRKRHNEERNYKCEICSKGFKLFTDRSTHMKVHLEVRKYKCELCLKTFKVRRNMMRHMNVHTKDGTYRCEVCVKSYKNMKYLMQHVKTQHKSKQIREQQFQCYTCGNDFYNKRNLMHHIKTHEKYSVRKLLRNVNVFASGAQKVVSMFQKPCYLEETNLFIKEENLEFGSDYDKTEINDPQDAKGFIGVKLEPTEILESPPQCIHDYVVVKEEKNLTDVSSSIQKHEISNTNIDYITNKLERSIES